MIGVIIPAHNEAECIQACLASIGAAIAHPKLHERVQVIVAVDRCCDATAAIAMSMGAVIVEVAAPGGVGAARAAAAAKALELGADWLAVTDADSRVPDDWLVGQRNTGADAFCGIVEVEDWLDFPDAVRLAFAHTQARGVGHGRIHGANMGVSAAMYSKCGGFPLLGCNEDVGLIRALEAQCARIAWASEPVVWTSARRSARARGGFADFLKTLEAAQMPTLNASTQPV